MKFLTIAIITVFFCTAVVEESAREVSIQFFGDLFLSERVLEKTGTTPDNPAVFSETDDLLRASDINVVNFEGVATTQRFPAALDKAHYLKMPPVVGQLLRRSRIHVATLANNHTMDYGHMGLFESLASLDREGLQTVGAGSNLSDALKPAIVTTTVGNICILAFSRTLPEQFWAKESRAGTANLDYAGIQMKVADCAEREKFTFVVFHWGAEMTSEAKEYQKQLARRSIDAGADAVIGHHPHVLQEIEFYRDKPIFYSLGNYVFSTLPGGMKPEGMAVRFTLTHDGKIRRMILTPLNVHNQTVGFIPRRLAAGEPDPIHRQMPWRHGCSRNEKKRHWECRF